MALTDAQKRANAADIARRKALGEVKRTYWMAPETLALMRELRATHKSNDKVIEAAVAAYGRPRATHLPPKPVKPVDNAQPAKGGCGGKVAPTPSKPASEPEKRPSVALKSRPAFNPQPKTGKKK